MQARKWFGLGAAVVALAMIAMAQEAAPSQQKVIKHVPVKQTSPASGKEMFTTYCAVCHGTDGKGQWPGCFGAQGAAQRSHGAGREKFREVSRDAYLECSARRSGDACSWIERYAGVGPSLPAHQSGS